MSETKKLSDLDDLADNLVYTIWGLILVLPLLYILILGIMDISTTNDIVILQLTPLLGLLSILLVVSAIYINHVHYKLKNGFGTNFKQSLIVLIFTHGSAVVGFSLGMLGSSSDTIILVYGFMFLPYPFLLYFMWIWHKNKHD